MKLSAPVFKLRSRAKTLKKQRNISLHEALNEVAQAEGFAAWSLLMAKQQDVLPNSLDELIDYLNPGDLALLGARPLLGKTQVAAGLIAAAGLRGSGPSHFFTLVEREDTIRERIENYLDQAGQSMSMVNIDCGDNICAEYIEERLADEPNMQGKLVVIDYLQVLDESRTNPPLQNQVESLSLFAKQSGCIILFISQLSRNVDSRPGTSPTIDDIRLPNPLELQLFNKILFLMGNDRSASQKGASLCISRPHQHKIALGRTREVFKLTAS